MEAQDPLATINGLVGFAGRGAGSDAERRAADWLAKRCAPINPDAEVETFWCRPNWAAAHLWHIALAVAGSLTALASPIAGIVLLGLALASLVSDSLAGVSLGRRLTPERASQNVVAPGPEESPGATRLIITANYDAGRVGLAYRRPLRAATATVTRTFRGAAPGWLGWTAFAIVWLLVVTSLRQAGHHSQLIGAIQFPPTIGLVIGFALLLELSTGNWSPGANDNASGVSAALAVADALHTVPPRHLTVELVLAGADASDQIGLRRYLRARRRMLTPPRGPRGRRQAPAVVLGLGPCGSGTPYWWLSDGSLLPLRFSPTLRRIAQQVAQGEPHLVARPHRGRGSTGAFAARSAGLPALTIGCLEGHGLATNSHQKTDLPDTVDRQAIDHAVQFALLLIDGIDAAVGEAQREPAPTPA
jgi:hypothetical protein